MHSGLASWNFSRKVRLPVRSLLPSVSLKAQSIFCGKPNAGCYNSRTLKRAKIN